MSYKHCRESLSYMAVEKPEGTIVLTSFIGGSSYFQVSEQGPSFWGEMLSENHNALRKDLVTRSNRNLIVVIVRYQDIVQIRA